jgi:hypothetical protein
VIRQARAEGPRRHCAPRGRHCERSEAIHAAAKRKLDRFVASLHAMTGIVQHTGAEAMKQPCVYIMASRRRGTLYTGVTANPPRRAFEHREGLVKGFSAKYSCKILV